MTWAKLDDRYDDHPKVKRAWRLSGYAVGLHAAAITAACRHESDGLVDPEWLADRLAHLPRAAARRALDTLVRLRLFDELPAGEVLTLDDGKGFAVQIGPLDEDAYVVHDFLDHNPSSAYLADKRRRDSERKSQRRRRESRRSPDGFRAESNGSPQHENAESRPPVPSRPVPSRREPAVAGSPRRASGLAPRPAGRVDQLTPPRELPAEIADRLDPVLAILTGIHEVRGGNVPTPRGVGLALIAFPRRDHVGVARELEHWALAGNGQHKPIKDLVRTYRTFLERAPDADPAVARLSARPGAGRGVSVSDAIAEMRERAALLRAGETITVEGRVAA